MRRLCRTKLRGARTGFQTLTSRDPRVREVSFSPLSTRLGEGWQILWVEENERIDFA